MDGRQFAVTMGALVLAGGLSTVSAAVIPVGGACTLPDAIAAANTDSAIGGCPAAPLFRIFRVGPSGSLTLRHVTLRGGRAVTGGGGLEESGGAILVPYDPNGSSSTLVLDHANLAENSSRFGGAVYSELGAIVTHSDISRNSAESAGGGLYLWGFATIQASTISENHAGSGGGLSGFQTILTVEGSNISGNVVTGPGGGIWMNEGRLRLLNSTVSGNQADEGGGVYAPWAPGTTETEARHTTIVGNTANVGGGVYFNDYGEGGFAALAGSIVAGNTGPGGDCGGPSPVTDGGGNFAGDGTCGPGFAPIAPATGFDATLADNGGPTATHALPEGSPAIDAAGACGLDTDQRGVARDDGLCDSGAFEFAPVLINGNFASGALWPWRLHTSDWEASATVNQGMLRVDVGPGGPNVISQLYQKDLALEGDTTYALRFDASSSLGSNLRVRMLQHVPPFESYGLAQNVNIQPTARTFEIVFTTTPGDKVDARLSFLLQFKDRSGFAVPGEVYVFDNISLVKLDGHAATRSGDSADTDGMLQRGFRDSLPTRPRLDIWH